MSTENGLSQQNGNGASVEVAQLQEMRGGRIMHEWKQSLRV